MAEEGATSTGSASHLGANEYILDGHFVNDYSKRRVPLPVVFYMGIADAADKDSPSDLNGKWVLSVLYEYLNPAFIADEQMDAGGMQPIIDTAFQKVNQRVIQECANRNIEGGRKLSLTVIIAGSGRAFIGQAGDCKAFLHNDMKLLDVTPGQAMETAPVPEDEMPSLFSLQETEPAPANVENGSNEKAAVATAGPSRGKYLGESNEVTVGFSELEIVPGDILILCSDGFHKNVPQDEIGENLNSSNNLERVANQLIRAAFNRDNSDNATFSALKYSIPSVASTDYGIQRRMKAAKTASEKIMDILVFMLLGIVLCGILGLGFIFGWKIASAVQGPDRKNVHTSNSGNTDNPDEVVVKVDTSVPIARVMVIEGSGVRMRSTPSTKGKVLGLLSDGQEVTVIEEINGDDGNIWFRITGTVRTSGKYIEREGYVSIEFLKEPGSEAKEAASESTSPSSTAPSTTTPVGTTPN